MLYQLSYWPIPLPGPGLDPAKPGAHDRTRTGDLLLTKEVLYRLSYMGSAARTQPSELTRVERETGLEPATFSLEG